MTLAAIAVVCVTVLAALVLVLRHLAAMRATSGEMAILSGRVDAAHAEMKAFDSKLTMLNNRSQR